MDHSNLDAAGSGTTHNFDYLHHGIQERQSSVEVGVYDGHHLLLLICYLRFTLAFEI